MTLQQALSYSGNEYQSMTYEELAEVTRAMAEAARKRLGRLSEGHAYEIIRKRATGAGLSWKANALTYDRGKIKISQKFKGKNRMSMGDLRTLRKVLTEYLRDQTSTKKGNEEFKNQVARVITDDEGDISNIWTDFNRSLSNTDLINLGVRRLDWQSGNIYNAIIESGGYEKMWSGSADFTRSLKNYMKDEIEKIEKSDPYFFDSIENHIESKPSFFN